MRTYVVVYFYFRGDTTSKKSGLQVAADSLSWDGSEIMTATVYIPLSYTKKQVKEFLKQVC